MSAPCPLLGFHVRAALRDAASDREADMLIDSFIVLLEANDLSTDGDGRQALEWAVHRDGSQATDADRHLVLAWATQWRHLADVTVSDLSDFSR